MNLELDAKVVLVTGGSDGLGLALCHRLVEERASVALCGRDPERLAVAVGGLEAAGGDVLGVRADVTDPADLSAFVDRAVERFGRVDGLVNNAGASAAKKLEDTDDGDWDADIALKVSAAVRLSRMLLPLLRRSAPSAIVNVLAIGAKAPGSSSMPSSVTRAAGLALTKALSRELGPDHIRVNAVLIGLIESGQWRRRAEAAGRSADEFYASLATDAGVPLGRVGRSGEFADLVTYLLSSRSSYVTGTAINVDGGLCAAP